MAFYLSYLVNISIYTVLIFTIMVTFTKKLDKYIPKYDETKKRWITICEIYFQLIMIVGISYIVREVLNYYIKSSLDIVGNPDKFAIIILGAPMFSQQPNLINKIKFIWKNI